MRTLNAAEQEGDCMSAENKKLLWISVVVCVFVLVVALAALFFFAPSGSGGTAPATAGNIAAPKASDPQDFLNAPPPSTDLYEPRTPEGDVIVIYGDKPSTLPTDTRTAIPGTASGEYPFETAPGLSTPTTAAPGTVLAPSASYSGNTGSAAYGAGTSTAAKTQASTNATAAKPAAAAKPKAPVAKPAVAKPAAKPVLVKVDEYWIQAASFASRGRADELKSALAKKGLAALIAVKDIDGKSWYRVRIGPYSAKNEADGWMARIKAVPGCSEAYIAKTTVERAKK